MANENTARRALYLPPELDNWLVQLSESSGNKINTIIIQAIRDHHDSLFDIKSNEDEEFKLKVIDIIDEYNKNCHITGDL